MSVDASNETSGTGSGGDDWLTTYADAITLLMAFFVMILSTAELNEGKYEVVQNSIKNALSGGGPVARTTETEGDTTQEAKKQTKKEVNRAKQALVEIKKKLSKQIQQGQVSVAQEGKRVTIEFSSVALFPAGKAKLKDTMKPTLEKMTLAIIGAGKGKYRIDIEGHTDDIPISSSRFPSNWELSASRATHVLRYLVRSGLPRGRIRAIGLADTQPKAPHKDAAGKSIAANRALNRRVVVHLDWGVPASKKAKAKKKSQPALGGRVDKQKAKKK